MSMEVKVKLYTILKKYGEELADLGVRFKF